LSAYRPSNSKVKNAAMTTTGPVEIGANRYSSTIREVGQCGRRGALMLSMDIDHKDAENFIDAKMEQGKITGANVSVKIDDEFMRCVASGKPYKQQFPINSQSPRVVREIDARKLWNKIIHNAWQSAEPGVLFWDTIIRESVPDCYDDFGFKTVSTNPCGEIPLCDADSCRLLHLNMYSFVENPYTSKAEFNWKKLEEMTRLAVDLLDDIVDIELEKVQAIIDKIKSDPEDDSVKRTELELWERIYNKGKEGRRLGLGTTADGDMVAAMGLVYGTQEANDFLEKVHKCIGVNSYMESILLAEERGAFEVFDWELEKDDYFVNKMLNGIKDLYGRDIYDIYYEKWKSYGRRNIACLTLAPVGSGSTQTQTSSGFEPVFSLFYQRKSKIDDKSKADFIDEVGDAFEINNVIHHKFVDWYMVYSGSNDYQSSKDYLSKLKEDELNELIKKSPYYGATANEIDPIMKVKLQGAIQNWIDNSISCTVNLPESTTVETVNNIYLEAYKAGCKGTTIYRDGCRSGVLTVSSTPKKSEETTVKDQVIPIRPDELDAEVVRFRNGDEQWIAYIGIKDGHPYEIFTGLEDKEEHVLPKSVTKGKLIRVNDKKKKRYDFSYVDKYGYTNTIGGISHMFNKVYWNYAKFISGYLRNNVPLVDTINVLEGLSFDKDTINTWKNGVIRALKKYIKDGTESKSVCPECGAKLVFENGCKTCKNCGYSAC
jgi:ribonucleoside-diphosphate reductase alpha chain